MKIEWLGHSSFAIEEVGKNLLIDPFLAGNPACPEEKLEIDKNIDAIIITHGHGDHLGDALALAQKNDCTVFAIYEICCWMEAQGHSKCEPMNTGGSVPLDENITISLVNAQHSASLIEEGKPVYMGTACGAVISGPTCTLYHAGDTGIFSDMALIQRIYQPDVGLIPIGDRFTMGPDTAAIACNELLDLKLIIPMHYGTFPLLTGTPEDFEKQVKRGEVRTLHPGTSTEFAR